MDNQAICHHVGGAAKLGHPVKQHHQSVICSLCVAEYLEEVVDDADICLEALLEEVAKEGERQARAVRTAAAVHEDAICAGRGPRHPSAGALGHAAEEGNREGWAVAAGTGWRSAGEGG